jgi:Zn-dependent protease
MKTLRLVRVAAEAERLRWQRFARRLVVRAVLGAIAAFFALAAVVVLHGLGYLALREQVSALIAASIILGVDVVLALLFGILASRGGPDAIEREALVVRQTAVAEIGKTFALLALARTVASLLRRR